MITPSTSTRKKPRNSNWFRQGETPGRRLENIAGFEGIELVRVTKDKSDIVSTFLVLGRNYLSELHMPTHEQQRFLQSILARQGELDRWLLLLKNQRQYLGFVHVKIDKDERPGWGFILEFYVVPDNRRLGWGRTLLRLVTEILQDRGAKHIWLLASAPSDSFWRSLGFRETGEIQDSQKVMILSMSATN